MGKVGHTAQAKFRCRALGSQRRFPQMDIGENIGLRNYGLPQEMGQKPIGVNEGKNGEKERNKVFQRETLVEWSATGEKIKSQFVCYHNMI